MADEDGTIQLVTFQLGRETYGIDIMGVKEIVALEEIRTIPTAPPYVAGILNLRGVFVPIINLHKRFRLERASLEEIEELLSGFVIIQVRGRGIGIIIDRVSRVVTIDVDSIQPPPQMLSGIGAEYIQGVAAGESGEYLIILDVARLFNPRELSELDSLR